MPSRRDMLRTALAVPAAAAFTSRRGRAQGPRVVVVGAGAFGGWTALELVRRGARVTLIDAWGPGNVRASSGGETRVIRATYGARAVYTKMAIRALELWRAHDQKFQRGFFKKTGALWMFGKDDSFGKASLAALRAVKQPVDDLSPATARRRYPQINFDGVTSILSEPEAGYLLARRACEHVVERVVAEGGTYRTQAVVSPVRVTDRPLQSLPVGDGAPLSADAFVFACGPWLGSLFPDVCVKSVEYGRPPTRPQRQVPRRPPHSPRTYLQVIVSCSGQDLPDRAGAEDCGASDGPAAFPSLEFVHRAATLVNPGDPAPVEPVRDRDHRHSAARKRDGQFLERPASERGLDEKQAGLDHEQEESGSDSSVEEKPERRYSSRAEAHGKIVWRRRAVHYDISASIMRHDGHQ